MALSDAFQTLSAAFAFGTLFQAAAPAIFLLAKGHVKTLFKDGRRLVLVLFLFFAALWAQIEFLVLLMPTTMTSTCSIAVITTTALDQLARVMIEQFLLWSVGHGTKMTTERLLLQGVLLLRIIAGGVLVGFTRTDLAPTCLARTSVLPVGIIVLSLDAVIFGVLVVRSMSLGLFSEMRNKKSVKRQQSRALVFSVLGFGFWTASSVPMILGIPALMLLLRTVLPANGLLVLASIVVGFSIVLLEVREDNGITPEARSPFMNNMPPTREVFQENSNNTGSPVIGPGYTRNGSLFIVNPSTPNDSPTVFQGASRNGDTKGFTKLSEEITVMENSAPVRPERPDGKQARNAPGYRGSSGVFASMMNQGGDQGAFAPQIRANVSTNTQAVVASQQKRSLFSRSKAPPKTSIRSLGISQPIAQSDGSSAQPFVKIPTMDLATAARMERERRDEAAAARSKIVANRPAPPPPARYGADSTRSTEPYLETKPMPEIPESAPRSSIGGTNGSTTSASLSPGRDEVRRRSPRNGNGFNQMVSEKVPTQPTLQRKQTIGLPSNPRSQRALMAKEPSMAKEQTVMLINEIVYDQPGLVKTIINNAPIMYAKRPKTADASTFSSDISLKSSNSIIHRPRPYKKPVVSDDRQLFPTEPSPGHKRSKSSSSIIRQRSILMSQPGSPTRLPPLPLPPTSAKALTKLLPNSTKSMTFDEKIQLLFPAPPGPVKLQYRRSSVPSIPRMPSVFIADSPISSPMAEEQRSYRTSKRTTLASFGLDNLDISASSPKQDLNRFQERQISRFSSTTYQSNRETSNESTVSTLNLLGPPTRQSVFDDLRKSRFTHVSNGDDSLIDDAITDWASIHSKVPAIDLSKEMRNANQTFIQRPKVRAEEFSNVLPRPAPKQEESTESIPMMLDVEEPRRSFLLDASAASGTFFFDEVRAQEEVVPVERSWHRRIGDELPTFSERAKPRSRKMPPPTPLLLSRNGRQARVVVRNAEPSPPADSPERAIREIQEQLKRFEDPNRVSVGSLLERLPNAGQGREQSQDNSRLRLLDNLEMEMGQQENRWQQMQTNLDRDSMSIAATPLPEAQPENISRESSQRSSRVQSRVLDRRSRIRSGMTTRSKSKDSSHAPSTDSSDDSRASVWQRRLANAQMEYTAHAPALLRKGSLNFLSVYKAPAELGSPTPPDSVASETDNESESDSGSFEYADIIERSLKKPATLWRAPIASPKSATGRLWNHPNDRPVTQASSEPLAKNLRPMQRHIEQPLQIFSAELWSRPRSAEHSRPVVGLWGSKLVRPKSIITRPVTQRPARRSRRVTFLPDIVESPVPLPNKRETLGIFQFPWGEKSDQPVYQPAFNPTLISGPILNSQFEARSRQLEPEAYSSSFFDDYEEEDEDDVIDEDSEDDFDESTLWEIASLLNSSDVPSKQSLFLPRTNGTINDYESDDFKTEAGLSETVQTKSLQMSLPIQPLEMPVRVSPRASLEMPLTKMWSPLKLVTELPSSGLFSKSINGVIIRTTEALPAAINMLKAPRKVTIELPILASSSLWTRMVTASQETNWISNKAVVVKQVSTMMWCPAKKATEVTINGLFDNSVPRSSYRTTRATPAAINMICKPRKTDLPLDMLVSTKLWSQTQKLNVERDWISESSIRPLSPSVYSPSSSGASSPISDASSVRSTSTKASSIAASFSTIPSWWTNIRSKNNSPSQPTMEPTPNMSKIPVRQPLKPLASVRESKVLASRNMWESMVPTIEKTPSQKFRRATITRQPTKPSRQAMRQQYRPNGTFQASWDEALKEAIAASRIKPTLKRVFSKSKVVQPIVNKPATFKRVTHSLADWDSALTEAIALSAVPQSTTLHTYDSASMHPVFFTESFNSSIVDVHPAAIGHFIVKQVSSLWSLESVISTSATDKLWTKAAVVPRMSHVSNSIISTVVRKPLSARIIELPTLNSSSLWKPTQAAPITRDWMVKAQPKSAQMWTVAKRNIEAENVSMWAVRPSEVAQVPDIFVNIKHDRTRAKASRKEVLSALTSKSLYISTPLTKIPTDWLHQTSKTSKPLTWTASIPTVHESQDGMWTLATQRSLESLDLFASLKHQFVRASTSRSTSTLPVLMSSELFAVKVVPKSRTHWLHQTSKSMQSKTWNAPSPAALRIESGMWGAAVHHLTNNPDLFANIKHDCVRASSSYQSSTALPILTSNKLFTFVVFRSPSTHWLHQTSKPIQSKTWNAPTIFASKPEGGMWSAPAHLTATTPDLFANPSTAIVRSTPSGFAALPVLESNKLFEVGFTSKKHAHWLHQTSKLTKALTWTPPATKALKQESGMWTAPPKSAATSPDIFSIQSFNVRSTTTQSAPLAILNSNTLFTPTMTSTTTTKHWLHTTSLRRKTAPRKRSPTWSAPAPKPAPLLLAPEQSNTMWIAKPILARSIPSPMMFTDMNMGPWTRTKRSDSAVGGIESQELWSLTGDANANESRDWLVESQV